MKLRKGSTIRFISMDDLTGEKIEVIGKIIGDWRKIREGYPEECAWINLESEVFLVEAQNYAERFLVYREEILKSQGKEAQQ